MVDDRMEPEVNDTECIQLLNEYTTYGYTSKNDMIQDALRAFRVIQSKQERAEWRKKAFLEYGEPCNQNMFGKKSMEKISMNYDAPNDKKDFPFYSNEEVLLLAVNDIGGNREFYIQQFKEHFGIAG